ncbi:phosphoenolpyruvate synthase [Oceanithermus desulfurans]|uniref:Phosphoenolpyruvate synthase n=2 Tax=Oceanithermus desulfurans TaxID=227924 RepID=A0A511RIV2_9DEIN|nr:phosphoenolpyruvate synthase [Oceanithermus desulfurans]MBB6029732.1 pyruvate,water dikinase [Oceanithermus desulfurans]GEM89571.1 phosphoenolpyruvate synthase [Oceanithermus desulfurans NBRC 100063]
MKWVKWFSEVGIHDVPLVGGKNASLGEMLRTLGEVGVRVPDGFAVTAEAYRYYLRSAGLEDKIRALLDGWDRSDPADLIRRARRIRNMIVRAECPEDLRREIAEAYAELSRKYGTDEVDVAVRSSATAEDLPTASFAGQQDTYLMVHGEAELLLSVRRAFASLFTARAISYREDMGFDHFKVALSVGVQKMVRSDLASSGVIFTLDTETGFRDVVLVTSIWGLGENIVQGRVVPDEFYVHKPTLRKGFPSLVWKKLGAKEFKLVYDEQKQRLSNQPTPRDERERFSLEPDEVLQLARWAVAIEDHYSKVHGEPTPMDIEWAKDGLSGELFIVQARPETVHSQRKGLKFTVYELKEKGKVLVRGLAVGEKIASGKVRVITDPNKMDEFQPGEVLVTTITDPDWEPIMKEAAAIVTDRGGRTSHAAIVARELGIPAVVGSENATRVLRTGQEVTVSCAEGEDGRVYEGRLAFEVHEVDPETLPKPERTRILLNVGNPELAFKLAQYPVDGVGLARMEFIFASWIRVHPLALTRYDQLPIRVKRQVDELTQGYPTKEEYFIDKLAQGIAVIAAAFYPREVILRFSDFKTNEYAHLLGGELFEPREENPMLGWRGASRYYHPDYKEGFLLELAAVKRVREDMGLDNLKVMVPFCRTPEEGRQVLKVMREGGLEPGKNGLEVYVMAEIPSNIWLADAYADVFDGFSIGSNDLTQLTLGVDRDSDRIAALFDERNEAVKRSVAHLIERAHAHAPRRKVGICGQAPSDYPEFAAFLVEKGIDSISLNPDAVLRTMSRVVEMEQKLKARG